MWFRKAGLEVSLWFCNFHIQNKLFSVSGGGAVGGDCFSYLPVTKPVAKPTDRTFHNMSCGFTGFGTAPHRELTVYSRQTYSVVI